MIVEDAIGRAPSDAATPYRAPYLAFPGNTVSIYIYNGDVRRSLPLAPCSSEHDRGGAVAAAGARPS